MFFDRSAEVAVASVADPRALPVHLFKGTCTVLPQVISGPAKTACDSLMSNKSIVYKCVFAVAMSSMLIIGQLTKTDGNDLPMLSMSVVGDG